MRDFASCCIDTSDGVCAALNALADLNACGYAVANLPYLAAGLGFCRRASLPGTLLFLGECGEYELLFTVRPERDEAFLIEARNWAAGSTGSGQLQQPAGSCVRMAARLTWNPGAARRATLIRRRNTSKLWADGWTGSRPLVEKPTCQGGAENGASSGHHRPRPGHQRGHRQRGFLPPGMDPALQSPAGPPSFHPHLCPSLPLVCAVAGSFRSPRMASACRTKTSCKRPTG